MRGEDLPPEQVKEFATDIFDDSNRLTRMISETGVRLHRPRGALAARRWRSPLRRPDRLTPRRRAQ
jgi:hypothetical protein